MRIKVLGCSGTEFPGSNSPALLLQGRLLFDAGSLSSALNERAQLRITDIFITHAHLDHVKGIPFLADNILASDTGSRVSVFSISPVLRTIRTHLFNNALWPDFTVIPTPTDGIVRLVQIKVSEPKKVDSYHITAYRVNHTVPAVGYLVEDKNCKRFFYTGDTGPTPQTWKAIGPRKLEGLIIDVSFPNRLQGLAVKSGHLTPKLLRRELSQIISVPERIYVIHPKAHYLHDIRREIRGLGLSNIRLLREGETIKI